MIESCNNVSFGGYYKVPIIEPNQEQDQKTKECLKNCALNTAVLGVSLSTEEPRISKDKAFVYFNIKDSNNQAFENGVKEIVNECNKGCSIDLASKCYAQKVDEAEFKQAEKA